LARLCNPRRPVAVADADVEVVEAVAEAVDVTVVETVDAVPGMPVGILKHIWVTMTFVPLTLRVD
jgi:hypothetical protein